MNLSFLAFRPPVIAHRGARALAPENTLAAFRRAREEGARWIETDVKLTHDGIPIIMHDDTLDRTTDGKGPVADITWADMQKLDAGSWFDLAYKGEHVPRLAEVLRFVLEHNMRINLELKPCPGRAQATAMVTLIEAAKIWPHDRPPPLISSFDIEALMIAAGLHPEWPRGLLLEEWRDDWADLVHKTKASVINLDADLLTEERVEAIVKTRLPVLAFTISDPARAKELLHWGVKAVFSDNPGTIIKAL
jgi:glycerophosphoryl diester phosphodiesterase